VLFAPPLVEGFAVELDDIGFATCGPHPVLGQPTPVRLGAVTACGYPLVDRCIRPHLL